jgi:hypothetical protein
MRLSPYALAVTRAVEIAGGVNSLATGLGLSSVLVRACLAGSHETPASVFLKAVDYLMAQDPMPLNNSSSMEKFAEPSGDEQTSSSGTA